MESILLSYTIQLLEHDKYSWPATARTIGVSRSWLAHLYSGIIRDPGVVRVERLYLHLATKYPHHPASILSITLNSAKNVLTNMPQVT